MNKILPYILAIALGIFIYLYITKPSGVVDTSYQTDMDSLTRVIQSRNITIAESDLRQDTLLLHIAKLDSIVSHFDSIHLQAIYIHENIITDIDNNSLDDDLGYFAREYANRKRD